SKYSDSDAGPSTVSTRTPVACTISRRPVREISWKSPIGKPSPTAILSSCPMRPRLRGRIRIGQAQVEAVHFGRAVEAEHARCRLVGVDDETVAMQHQRCRRAAKQLAVARLARHRRALGPDLA